MKSAKKLSSSLPAAVLEIEAYINGVLDRAMREIDRKNRHDRYLEVPELGNLYNIQNMRLTKLAFAKYEALTRRGTSIYDASCKSVIVTSLYVPQPMF